MTELSVMLISGKISEGGSVRIGFDAKTDSLTYTIEQGANGQNKKRPTSGAPGIDTLGYMNNSYDEDAEDEMDVDA